MSEEKTTLADFFKAIAEEKKKSGTAPIVEQKIVEEKQNDMSDYLSALKGNKSFIPEMMTESPIAPSQKPIKEQEDYLNKIDLRSNYVTQEDLNRHYKTFVERVQKQLTSLGGGGEVRIARMADFDASTLGNNKHLAYDTATRKFFMEDVSSATELTDDNYTTQILNDEISVINVPNSVIGPIQGIQFDITHNHDSETVGTLCWNADDDTLNLRHTGGVVQQIGQEQYAYVRNNTGSTITNGAVVQFSGAEDSGGEARLEVAPFLADGTFPSLYTLGVATQDIVDGEDGRVTVWGKVRDLNTSGTPVGETWVVGDVLFANPNTAGALTKVKPTAPNNVVPIVAVLKVDSDQGQLFVRPTVEQKMTYGKFARTTDVTVDGIDSAGTITFDTNLGSNGVTINNGGLLIDQSGFYQIDINAQIDVGGGVFNQGTMYLWLSVNDSDVTYSTRRQAITSTLSATTMANTVSLSLDANDILKVKYAGNDTALLFDASPATAFAPSTAAVLISISQIQL